MVDPWVDSIWIQTGLRGPAGVHLETSNSARLIKGLRGPGSGLDPGWLPKKIALTLANPGAAPTGIASPPRKDPSRGARSTLRSLVCGCGSVAARDLQLSSHAGDYITSASHCNRITSTLRFALFAQGFARNARRARRRLIESSDPFGDSAASEEDGVARVSQWPTPVDSTEAHKEATGTVRHLRCRHGAQYLIGRPSAAISLDMG